MTTMGKYRHMARCSTERGVFCIAAIDHRGNLRERMAAHHPGELTDADFITFKKQVVTNLMPHASGLLIDPVSGIGAGISEGWIPAQKGMLSPIEITDYDIHPGQRDINFIPDWGVAKIKQIGGDGVKLLLPYHPNDVNTANRHEVVERVVDECSRHDLPFFLEPITYSPDPDTPLSNDELRQIVVHMAKTFSEMGVDVLKMQFPLDVKQTDDEAEWQAACEEVTAACRVPWALLSAGVDFDTFVRQTEIACKAGASGIIVGRAIWTECLELHGQARAEFFRVVAAARMAQLQHITAAYARPWWADTPQPDASEGWMAAYSG